MKKALLGGMILATLLLTACASSPPPRTAYQRPSYGDRSLTDSKGPRIYSRKNIWKLVEQQDQKVMRQKAQKNFNRRMTHWDAIKERMAWQKAVALQKEKERQAILNRRFNGFF